MTTITMSPSDVCTIQPTMAKANPDATAVDVIWYIGYATLYAHPVGVLGKIVMEVDDVG